MEKEFIIPYIISNAVSITLIIVSLKWKQVSRVLFALIFILAAWANWHVAHADPNFYLTYSNNAIGFYQTIINGFFSHNITAFVSFIAICQFFIGLGLLSRDLIFRTACIGGIIFLVAIAPLGVGSAFPCSLVFAAGLLILYKHPCAQNIFNNKWVY